MEFIKCEENCFGRKEKLLWNLDCTQTLTKKNYSRDECGPAVFEEHLGFGWRRKSFNEFSQNFFRRTKIRREVASKM